MVIGFDPNRSSMVMAAHALGGAPPVTLMAALLPSVKVTDGQDVEPELRQPAVLAAAKEM